MVGLMLTACATLTGCGEKATAPPPLEIPYIVAEPQNVAIPMEVVGETLGSIDVSIRSRVDGFLDGIHFKEGDFVQKGQVLYTIDPQPFEAKLAQAEATYAQAQTNLTKARSDLDRIRPLAEMKAVSAQDLDSAVAGYDSAKAYVEAATAQVDLAKIELGYTKILSPIDGLIGLTQSEVGDFISQQNKGGLLNVVSSIDPTRVRAAITEAFYLQAARRLVEGSAQSVKDQPPNLTLILADGTVYEHRGHVIKIDRTIDPTTGSLTVEAEFPNPDKILRPGMFARVRFDAAEIENAILVPQRAVNELQSAYRIFVIGPDNVIEVRQVKVGPTLGSDWIITSGIQPGDRVAVEGLLRLREGMPVAPRLATAGDLPASDAASGP